MRALKEVERNVWSATSSSLRRSICAGLVPLSLASVNSLCINLLSKSVFVCSRHLVICADLLGQALGLVEA